MGMWACLHVSHQENDFLQESRHQKAAKASEEKGDTCLCYISCTANIVCLRLLKNCTTYIIHFDINKQDSKETVKLSYVRVFVCSFLSVRTFACV